MKIKVLIADDHQLFREGISTLLISSDNIEVIAEAKDGNEVIEKVKNYKPDVVLIDIAMPKLNGIEATKMIKTRFPEVKTITVSMHSEKQYVKGALEAGADGYLLKNCTYRQLTDAIQSVYEGKKYLSQDVTDMVISGYLTPADSGKNEYSTLSDREKEIFVLFAEGKSTREISEKLFISIKTVNTHKQNILDKLNLKSNTEIVKYAIKNGIILFE